MSHSQMFKVLNVLWNRPPRSHHHNFFSSSAECWLLCWRMLYGHASLHDHLRSIYPRHSTVWRLPSNQHPVLAQVDAIPLHGALCVPEHADRRVQRGTPYPLRRTVQIRRMRKCNLHPSRCHSGETRFQSTSVVKYGHSPRVSGLLQNSGLHCVKIL